MARLWIVALLLMAGTVAAQVDSPMKLDLGVGGGVSLPTGDLSNVSNTGWNVGAKLRAHGMLPLNIVGAAVYNRLPDKVGSEADTYLMLGGGIEYSVPAPDVHPYFGVDIFYNSISNTGAGSSSASRGGLGLGAGVEFSVPAFGSFDTSVKYQFLNMFGKEANEPDAAQIAATLSIMFSVL
jgi:hypothetical protein